MSSQVITLRISKDLLFRLDAATKNRAGFIKEAIEAKLNPVEVPELSRVEKREVLKDAKTITDYMRDAMMKRLQRESDLLDGMPKDEFLKLVAGRLPKEDAGNADLEQEVLSLRKCLEEMPRIEDITKELSRTKGILHKTELERDLNLKLLKHCQGKATFAELMESVYKGLVGYVVELISRNSLPGIGDGGGLSEKGYAEIAKHVKSELDKMELYRK